MAETLEANPKLVEEQEDEEEAEVQLWDYVFGFTKMAVVKCAIHLGIAESIENHNEPITLSELAIALKCSPPFLYRIMRFMVYYKFFKQQPNSCNTIGYVNTLLSRRLLLKNENSLRDFFLLESSNVMLGSLNAMSSRVLENGSSPFVEANGMEIWKLAQENVVYGKMFNDAMACESRQVVPALVRGCCHVFEGIESLVDVGGGNGTSLSLLVKAFPWIHGINFDVPHVVSVAPEYHGVKHVAGDMFKCVPKANAVFLKWILHDWSDEECIQILKKCIEAIPKENGKVIILEALIDEEKDERLKHVKLMLDIGLMTHTNTGKERTHKEMECLLHQAGFTRFNIIPIPALQSVIVAFP